jgi:Spy/CpxP family protein refolding chaperone
MNRKLVLLLVAFLTLAPLAAHDPVEAVQRVLQLDETQAQQLSEIVESWRLETAPLRRALRELQGHARELLGDPNPDPTAIGENQLRIQALRGKIREAEENCRLEFVELLYEEQQETYARIRRFARSARRFERIIPSFRELGLLGGAR